MGGLSRHADRAPDLSWLADTEPEGTVVLLCVLLLGALVMALLWLA